MSLNIDVANLPREAIERLLELAPGQGRVLVRRAFGDFRREDMDDLAIQLYQSGFHLVHCPAWPNQRGRLKSVVDDVMAQDLRDQLESAPEVEVFILGSGDRNFIAVANALKRHGRKVVVAADQESINRELRLCADEYLALPRNRGGRQQPQPEPEAEFEAPGGAELLDQIRLLAGTTDYLTLRRIVRAVLPDDVSGTGRVRSVLANNVQELIDSGTMRTERRVIRGRTVITLEIVEGDGASPAVETPSPTLPEVAEPAPVARRRTRRKAGVAALS
ncbi:MAG: NYN domain-containing protein [Chloroflexi bacterium]|nr:NYN domain-containing protein [Chloroflexota bacterium]